MEDPINATHGALQKKVGYTVIDYVGVAHIKTIQAFQPPCPSII